MALLNSAFDIRKYITGLNNNMKTFLQSNVEKRIIILSLYFLS